MLQGRHNSLLFYNVIIISTENVQSSFLIWRYFFFFTGLLYFHSDITISAPVIQHTLARRMPTQCTDPLAPDNIQMCACVISVSLAYCIVYLMYCIVSLAYCVVKAVATFLHAWVGNQRLDEAARTLKKGCQFCGSVSSCKLLNVIASSKSQILVNGLESSAASPRFGVL